MFDKFKIEVDMEQMMCSNCKKSSSEYYELLIQLRTKYFKNEDEIKEEIFNLIEKHLGNLNCINKLEEVDNGFDIYFRTHGIMNKISSIFSKKYMCDEKRSKKLIGRDQLVSKDKYRYFMSLSLINIQKGDKLLIKGEEYFVKAINANSVLILNDAKTGAKRQETYSIVKDYLKKL